MVPQRQTWWVRVGVVLLTTRSCANYGAPHLPRRAVLCSARIRPRFCCDAPLPWGKGRGSASVRNQHFSLANPSAELLTSKMPCARLAVDAEREKAVRRAGIRFENSSTVVCRARGPRWGKCTLACQPARIDSAAHCFDPPRSQARRSPQARPRCSEPTQAVQGGGPPCRPRLRGSVSGVQHPL